MSENWGQSFSQLLIYPESGLLQYVNSLSERLRASTPTEETTPEQTAAQLLDSFLGEVEGYSTEQLRELFIATFDLNPVCALEVGWQLFGEEYARGRFLVFMREQLRRFGVAESNELPDHLTLMLPLLEIMPEDEAGELARASVIPALDKMLDALGRRNNPYRFVLAAISKVLVARYGRESLEVLHA